MQKSIHILCWCFCFLVFMPLAQARDFNVRLDTAELEQAPRPQDDFYLSVNYQWLRDTPIPPEEKRVETFSSMDEKVRQQLADITRDAVRRNQEGTADRDENNIAALYACFQDGKQRETVQLGQLAAALHQVEQAATVQEYADTMAALSHELGTRGLVGSFAIQREPLENKTCVVWLQSPDIGLRRDFLLDKSNGAYFDAYRGYIRDLLVLYGHTPAAAETEAGQIFELQRDLAGHSLAPGELADTDNILQPLNLAGVQRLYRAVDAKAMLTAGGIGSQNGVQAWYASNPTALRRVNELLTPERLPQFKAYGIFKLLSDYAPYLTADYGSAASRYRLAMSGAAQDKSRERQMLEGNEALLTGAYGRLYASRYSSRGDCDEVKGYIQRILAGYRGKIQEMQGLSSKARSMALRKLDTMQLRVGYPEEWPAYLDTCQLLSPQAGGCLIDDVLALQRQQRAAELALLGQPIRRGIWREAVPQTVNAFYNPEDNSISFPAGILQAPLYDKKADPMDNLGGLGMIIAHEITHAFDSSGSQYDEQGRIRSWWTRKDWEAFGRRQDKIVRFYEHYRFPDGSRQNGQLTLVENMADLGALDCLTDLAGSGKEALRRLYTSYARTWRDKMTEAEFRNRRSDIHAVSAVRVNAVLSSTDGFYEAFSLEPSDAMYIAPADRMRFW